MFVVANIRVVSSVLENPSFHIDALLHRNMTDPHSLAVELATSELAAVVKWTSKSSVVWPNKTHTSIPVIMAHGMGDSCFNSGMKQIAKDVGAHVNSVAVCVPTGSNWLTDTLNGFFKSMDSSVDYFAKRIQSDHRLKGSTFVNMIGFSQGNSIIRGYIQKYNGEPGYPTVRTFLSVHGTVQGVGGFPQCNPEHGIISSFCRVLDRILGEFAYNSIVQNM